MDFFEVLKTRRSIRNFQREEKIPDEKLKQILESATDAPSAGNRQAWDFVIITKTEIKNVDR